MLARVFACLDQAGYPRSIMATGTVRLTLILTLATAQACIGGARAQPDESELKSECQVAEGLAQSTIAALFQDDSRMSVVAGQDCDQLVELPEGVFRLTRKPNGVRTYHSDGRVLTLPLEATRTLDEFRVNSTRATDLGCYVVLEELSMPLAVPISGEQTADIAGTLWRTGCGDIWISAMVFVALDAVEGAIEAIERVRVSAYRESSTAPFTFGALRVIE